MRKAGGDGEYRNSRLGATNRGEDADDVSWSSCRCYVDEQKGPLRNYFCAEAISSRIYIFDFFVIGQDVARKKQSLRNLEMIRFRLWRLPS